MTKAQVKDTDTQKLLEWLVSTAARPSVPKQMDKIGAEVCAELERRKIIASGESLYTIWRG